VISAKKTHILESKPNMSISNIGLTDKVSGGNISIFVECTEPLLLLADMLPWCEIASLVEDDLRRSSPKGAIHLGPKLYLRSHLASYILQSLRNLTDREMEFSLRFNALYQVFCGRNVIDNWRPPNSSSIEEFRNRLSPEIHREIGICVLKCASKAGFLDPAWMDIDSTVQEANMAYPSDVNIMFKLGVKAKAILPFINSKFPDLALSVDLKDIKSKVKGYFFLAKNTDRDVKNKAFSRVHAIVCSYVIPVIDSLMTISEEELSACGKETRNLIELVCNTGGNYLADVEEYIKTGVMVKGKILSLHLSEVMCICKGKAGKPFEFGRVFQLGRMGGNFLLVGEAATVFNSDKDAVAHMVTEHARIFGKGVLKSCATDRGYNTVTNLEALIEAEVTEIGVQHRAMLRPADENEKDVELYNRRAGIEPLIGHVKTDHGLGRSRMKSDRTTLSSGYRSVLGHNLGVILRHLERQQSQSKHSSVA